MNIDYQIEMLQAFKADKNLQVRHKTGSHWLPKVLDGFNFVDCEYRIAPDVVYKLEQHDRAGGNGQIDYVSEVEFKVMGTAGRLITKGYWVEGEL